MLSAGQTIERYTVEAFIGQGGMAMVYRVRHNHLGSLHALKILTVPRPNIRERLLQEGRVQAGLRHPNVVAVTDVLELEGAPALLMEYVDGPSLEQWLLDHTTSVENATALFRGICTGVGEAHRHGLVHRDLKPANVLLARTPSGIVPKVTDFGIAKILASDEVGHRTGTHVAMGTPCYMAPEQIRDARSVDQRADVFSLGCLLYELVSGVRPFDGPDVLAILNAVASGNYIAIGERVPGLPPGVAEAVEGALLVDRDTRLQTCRAVLDALGGVDGLDGRPVPVEVRPRDPSEVPQLLPTLPDPEPEVTGQTVVPHRRDEEGEATRAMLDLSVDPNASTVPSLVRKFFPYTRRADPWRGQAWFVGTVGLVAGLVAFVAIQTVGRGEAARIAPGTEERAERFEAEVEEPDPPMEPPAAPAAPAPPRRTPRDTQVQVPVSGVARSVTPELDGFLFSSSRRPAALQDGRITVSGNVRSVELVAESGRIYEAGPVPAGRYQVVVAFERGGKLPPIGPVIAEPGAEVRIVCFEDERACRQHPP